MEYRRNRGESVSVQIRKETQSSNKSFDKKQQTQISSKDWVSQDIFHFVAAIALLEPLSEAAEHLAAFHSYLKRGDHSMLEEVSSRSYA